MMPGYGHGMDGWGWIFMSVGTLVFLALIGVVVWVLARATGMGGRPTIAPVGSAWEILARRYAHSEIDEDEYRQRMAVLRGR